MHNTDVLLTFTCKGLGTNAANMVFFFLTLASTQQGVLGEGPMRSVAPMDVGEPAERAR